MNSHQLPKVSKSMFFLFFCLECPFPPNTLLFKLLFTVDCSWSYFMLTSQTIYPFPHASTCHAVLPLLVPYSLISNTWNGTWHHQCSISDCWMTKLVEQIHDWMDELIKSVNWWICRYLLLASEYESHHRKNYGVWKERSQENWVADQENHAEVTLYKFLHHSFIKYL